MSIVTRALTLMVLVVILLTAEAKGRVLKSQKLGGKSEKAGKEGKESNSTSRRCVEIILPVLKKGVGKQVPNFPALVKSGSRTEGLILVGPQKCSNSDTSILPPSPDHLSFHLQN